MSPECLSYQDDRGWREDHYSLRAVGGDSILPYPIEADTDAVSAVNVWLRLEWLGVVEARGHEVLALGESQAMPVVLLRSLSLLQERQPTSSWINEGPHSLLAVAFFPPLTSGSILMVMIGLSTARVASSELSATQRSKQDGEPLPHSAHGGRRG